MRNQEIDHNSGAFVGRLRELAELRAGIDGALAGRGRLMTLAGEAGVGKSRLADEVASVAADHGMRVLWGRCWEHGGAPAYWPWMQVVRDLASAAEPIALSDWMGPGAAEIAQIVPELHNQIDSLRELPSAALAQPDKARFRLFDAVVSFLRKAAETKPLLIVLDDLHAADSTSLLMLIALSRHVRASRAMVIGTYRDVDIKQSPERAALIAEAEREGVAFPLRGLDETEIGEFVQRGWGVSAADALVNSLHGVTDGNPFFLSEVLRQMAADGQLTGDLSKAPSQLNVPQGVSEFIKRLTQPLAPETYDALSAAAVIGREFTLASLEAASQRPRDSLIDHLDEAASLKIINAVRGAPGRYSFRHALIREALYDGLPPARRRRLHCAVAEAIRGLSGPADAFAEIAFHYCQGASDGDAELAIEFSRKAARTAERQLAYEDAARHLGNAIDLLGLRRGADDLLQAELLCELGEAQFKTGDLAESRKTCLKAADVARRIDQPALFARSVVAAGRGVSNSGVTDRSLVLLLNEAQQRLGGGDSPLRAQALARLGIELYWSEPQQAVALCEQAVGMARRLDDPHTLIVALWGRHLAMRAPDSLEQRLADTREAIAIAERAGERDFALEARFYGVADLLEAGDVLGADRALNEYLAAEAELRDRYTRGLLLRGMRAHLEGRLDEAATLAQQAFVGGQQSGRPLTLNSYLIQHGMTLWERGRLGELDGNLRTFVAQNPLIVFGRCGLQLSLLQLGRREEARIEFESLAEDEFRQVPRDWNWLPSMFVLADICAELGETDHAETLYRLLAPYARQSAMLGYVYSYGSVAFALGRLAALRRQFDLAETHFEAALVANRKIRATIWLAHTQSEFARMLLARCAIGDRERAAELMASARRTAEALDLGRLKTKLEIVGVEAEARKESATIAADLADGAEVKDSAGGRLALEPHEVDALEAVVASAVSRARDLGAQGSLEGTVTILFSDIEESTSLYERLGDLRAHEILRIHNEIVRHQVAAYRGNEVKALGDSFMVAFSSARRAALCAIAVQRSFAAYCESHPDLPIRVRIGLHVGEAINESADYFGKAVILAARIATLARGGQILVSSTLRDLAGNAGDLRFAPLGERHLKGLAGAHRIFEIVW